MKLDKGATIGGVSPRVVRDFLRRYRDTSWSTSLLGSRLDLTDDEARALTAALASEDFVAPVEKLLPTAADDPDELTERWHTTTKGNALAGTRTVRVKRAVAEGHLRNFLARVAEVNGDARWLYRIQRVVLFGSFLDPEAATVGDVDLAVELAWKGGERGFDGEPIQNYLTRALREGRRFRSFFDQLAAPEYDVRKYLKGGSRVISMHLPDELDALEGERWTGSRHKIIFDGGDPV